MTSSEQELAERIRSESVDLDRVVARVSAAWERGKKANSSDQDYFLDAVALNLHGFWGGLGRIFELIATAAEVATRARAWYTPNL